MPNHPNQWTKEEAEFAISHYENGHTSGEISLMLSNSGKFRPRSPDAVGRFLRRREEEKTRQPKDENQLRSFWTDEEVEFVVQCQKDGYSAGVTATMINDSPLRKDCAPVTRNAVIGVWNRNKEKLAPKEKIEKKPGLKREMIQKKLEIEEKLDREKKFEKFIYPPSFHLAEHMDKLFAPTKLSEREKMTIFNLKDGKCRFPFDDPRTENFHYCGEPVDYNKGRSYCSFHYRVCYQKSVVSK